ncbi:MAG: hypothetical protein RLZZ127_3276, partial [Planctomycetota bacterium]
MRVAALLLTAVAVFAGEAAQMRDAGGRIAGWVPEDTPVLRGMYFSDGDFPLDDWQEVLALWGYGHLRGAMHAYKGDRDAAIRDAIDRLAERTGHPELRNVPIVISGFSRFSGNADSLADRFPGRVLSYASGFDPGGRRPADAESLRIPSVKIANEVEDIFAADRTRSALGPRWQRTPWPLRAHCPQWREIHAFEAVKPFLMAYWDQVQRLRVPAGWDPRSGAPAMGFPAESSGWLGDTTGFWTMPATPAADDPRIAAFADMPAELRATAAWLPDEDTAWLWRAWTSRNPWAAFEQPCKPWEAGARHHVGLGLRVGATVAVTVRLGIPDASAVELWAWREPVGRTTAFAGGDLGGTRNAVASFTWTPRESRVVPLLARV